MENKVDYKALVGWKSFDELRLAVFEQLKAAKSRITNLNVGGVFRTFLELVMQGIADLYALLPEVVRKGYLMNAEGIWLDLKADELGLLRRTEKKAEGKVVFQRANTEGNAIVPADTIVKTGKTSAGEELRYLVKSNCFCPAGSGAIEVPVAAEFPGAKYNVGAGAIQTMVTHVPGFDAVANVDGWLTVEGADQEDDEALRERCRLRWNEMALGGTRLAYKSWTLGVSGVADVIVDDDWPRGNGTIDIIVLGSSGKPTDELIQMIQTMIDEKRPVCADVKVRAPLLTAVNIDVEVLLRPDSTLDLSSVKARVAEAVYAYFRQGQVSGIKPLVIGEDLLLFQLAAVIRSVSPEILNLKFNLPAADVPVSFDSFANLKSLQVTVGKADEV